MNFLKGVIEEETILSRLQESRDEDLRPESGIIGERDYSKQ